MQSRLCPVLFYYDANGSYQRYTYYPLANIVAYACGLSYGLDRMVEALSTDPGAEPEVLLRNVRQSVDSFVKDAPQFDDLTMMALVYKGAKNV